MACGFPLRNLLAFPLRLLALLLSLDVVATAAYHLRRMNGASAKPSPQLYAIIVIAGVCALYTLLTLVSFLLTVGALFLALIFLDLIFCGGFIALAVLLRDTASVTCHNLQPNSDLSSTAAGLWTSGSTLDPAYLAEPSIACKVDKAAFASSVASAVFCLCLAVLSALSFRRYRRNRAFGPGPRNDYRLGNNSRPGKRKSKAGLPEPEEGLAGGRRVSDQDDATTVTTNDGVAQSDMIYTRKPSVGNVNGAGMFNPEVGAGKSVGRKEAFGKGYSGF